MISLIPAAAKRYLTYGLGVLAWAGLLVAFSVSQAPLASAQSSNSLYVTPGNGAYGIGSSFTVSVRENSGSAVNAVQADLTYSNNLQFVSIDASGSAFPIDASSTGGNGSVSIARGTTTPVANDQLVARITFKVVSGGAGTISVQPSSMVLSSTTNTDVLSARNGSSYTLQGGSPAPPSPAGTPPASPSTTTPASNLPQITITPQGNAQTAPLPGESTVELESPATIVTTPDPNKKVTKVEYLINNKVVATDTAAPYTHSIDTTQYRNGKYTLTTKTYYADGKVDVSSSSIVIKNKFGPKQLWLQLRHYAWVIVILLVLIAELVYLKFFRKPRRPGGSMPAGGRTAPGSGSAAPTVPPAASASAAAPTSAAPNVVAPAGPVVKPTHPVSAEPMVIRPTVSAGAEPATTATPPSAADTTNAQAPAVTPPRQ